MCIIFRRNVPNDLPEICLLLIAQLVMAIRMYITNFSGEGPREPCDMTYQCKADVRSYTLIGACMYKYGVWWRVRKFEKLTISAWPFLHSSWNRIWRSSCGLSLNPVYLTWKMYSNHKKTVATRANPKSHTFSLKCIGILLTPWVWYAPMQTSGCCEILYRYIQHTELTRTSDSRLSFLNNSSFSNFSRWSGTTRGMVAVINHGTSQHNVFATTGNMLTMKVSFILETTTMYTMT